MLKIRQRVVELIITIRLGDQVLELDTAKLGHLENFLDIVGLPARHPVIVISRVTKLPLLIVNGPLPNPPMIVAVPPGRVA